MSVKRHTIAIAVGTVATCLEAQAADHLTVLQADKILRLAVSHQIQAKKLHRVFSLDPFNKNTDPNFYYFEAFGSWMDTSKPGSSVIGNYAVDRRDGKVWDLFSCETIHFEKLTKLQASYFPSRRTTRPIVCEDF